MAPMDEPIAYANGQIAPLSQTAVSLTDAGFVLGATVAEQCRTFAGKLFRLDDHLDRLFGSLAIVGLTLHVSRERLAEIAAELVETNRRLLARDDDLGLAVLVTPGEHPTYGASGDSRPGLFLHTYPLPFHLWAEKYETGQALVTTQIRQVPPTSWPTTLKCRSRMHYYLADREAAAADPGGRALLLDAGGHVTEASTANVVLFRREEGLVAPPRSKVLPGISLAQVVRLAERLGVPYGERDLDPADVAAADEVILTSTPLCLLPATRFDRQPVGSGLPGELFRRLLAAWSESVGVDIAGQARRFASRAGPNTVE